MEFKRFKERMQAHFLLLVAGQSKLFVTNVEKEVIWDTYLMSFPEEERQQHNCNACRQFLRAFGNVVAIVDNKVKSIWDFECDEPYQTVVKALDKLVTAAPVKDVYITFLKKIGTDFNHEDCEDGSIITWNHMFLQLPTSIVTRKTSFSEEALMGQARSKKDVLKRAFTELTVDAVQTVLELIAQNSLYRGQEFKSILDIFLIEKHRFDNVPEDQQDNYVWTESINISSAIASIRNSAIGTLLVDISQGRELDEAVSAYERIMAPSNYKRPTTLITKRMVEQAQETIAELGLENSLGRRYATMDDVTVNNVLFVNREAKKKLNVFDDLGVAITPKSLGKVEEIGIEDFIKNVLPTATSIEAMMANEHTNNLMSLIAPTIKDSKPLFKWDNSFSWAYNNDMADSIKEKVKAQGGNVNGVLRFSIMWGEDHLADNSDLDAHCVEPSNNRIYYANKVSGVSGGNLDVDITQPNNYKNKNIVENITFPRLGSLKPGKYQFSVHGFSIRGDQQGFSAEIEFDGQLYHFNYPKKVGHGQTVKVADVEWTGSKFIITKHLDSGDTVVKSRELWGVNTYQFQKVNMIMASPNYWDGRGVGNKHYFFMIDKCKNPGTPRGFFNEFLKDELMAQKRVFEALGAKMKVEPNDDQLSGLGFSTTNRASLILKVEGKFNRVLKVNF